MAMRIELTVEEEALIRAEAERRGQAPEEWATEMLRLSLRRPGGIAQPDEGNGTARRRAQWLAAMEEIRQEADRFPPLPEAPFTSETLYQDHD